MSVARGAPSTPQVPLPGAGPAGFARSLAFRAALVLAISAALAVGVAKLTAGGPAAPTPNAATPDVAEVQSVPAREAALFGVLRSPRTSADEFVPLREGAGPLGANPALARTVHEPRRGLSAGVVSVVPARGAICMRVPYGRVLAQWWCQRTGLAARGLLLSAVRPGGRLRASEQLVIGLVPDGVRTVVVTAAHGVRRVVAVRENVYETQIFDPHRVVIRLPAGGTVSYAAP